MAAKTKELKVSEKSIIDYLGREASYSLHKPTRKNFKRNQTVVGGFDQQWQADLAGMQALSRKNKGTKYRLTVIEYSPNMHGQFQSKTRVGLK